MPRRTAHRPRTRLFVLVLAAVLGLTSVVGILLESGVQRSVASIFSSDSCSDSDGGANYALYGSVSGQYAGRTYSHADECVRGRLYENECRGSTAIQTSIVCRNSCRNGACLEDYPLPVPYPQPVPYYPTDSCTDSDGGNKAWSRGTVIIQTRGRTYSHTDMCVGNTLYENVCVGPSGVQRKVDCPKGCINGACSNEEPETCHDTDRVNLYRRGSITGIHNGQRFTSTEQCIDSHRILEYYCNGNVPSQYFENNGVPSCPYQCRDGACISPPVNTQTTCRDTDGGLFYSVRGTVMGQRNGQAFSLADTCQSPTSIREYVCRDGAAFARVHTCSYGGCRNGVCMD